MATSNSRDVKMTLSVETLGEDGINRLQSDILKLAKEAGDAAPEFERLADEVGQLAAQAGSVRGLEALVTKVDELTAKQNEAAAAASALKERLDQQKASVTAAAADQKVAAQAYDEANAKLRQLTGELQVLRATYDANGKRADDYTAKLQDLTTKKVAQKEAVDLARAALRQENAELDAVVAAQTKLEAAYGRSEKAVERVTTQVRQQTGELERAKTAVAGYGLEAENLATAQAQVLQNLQRTAGAVNELQRSTVEGTQALREFEQANDLVAASLQDRLAATERAYQQEMQALQASVAEEQRVAALKEAIRDRTAALQRERAARENAVAGDGLRQQLAEEQAASDRLIALKTALRDRIATLANERAQRERGAFEASAAAAREAANAMERAFSTVGVRGVQEIEREILEVRNAMELVRTKSGETGAAIAGAMNAGEARVNALQREIRELTGQLTLADRAAGLFRNSLGQIAAGNLIADAVGALVERVKELGRQFIVVNVQAESVRRGLTALYGDTQIAAQQMDFLRSASLKAGISMSGITDSFVRFSAATKASGIGLAETNALFASLTQAGATLGLSTERVQLALDALGQIASKGVVSMEELRQQLGDSVPGALSLTAKGLGITDAELIKLVESGRLASRDFFPAFTKGLKELQGENNGLIASFGRLKTAFTTVAQSIGEAGFMDALAVSLKVVGAALGAVVLVLATFFEGVMMAARAAVAFTSALVGKSSMSEALAYLGEEGDKATARISKMTDSLNAALDPAGKAAARMQALAVEQEKVAAASRYTAEELTRATEGYATTAAASLQYEGATRAAATASQIAADATRDLGSRYVSLGVEIAKIQDSQEAEIIVRGKGVKAAKEQAEALTQVADLRGDELASAKAAVAANRLVIEAAEKEADAREALAATLAVELAEKTKLAIQQDGSIALRKQELDGIAERLRTAQAEAEASREEVRNLQATTAVLSLKTQTLKDNSSAVNQLRAESAALNAELAVAKRRFDEGKISADALTEVEVRAAQAAALYSDALQDQVEKLGAVADAKRASLDMSVASLQLELEVARSDEARAKRLGDEAGARAALVRQKEIEIQIAELQIQIQRVEAQGSIDIAKAKLEEAKATGTLTEAKRIELETEIKLAEIKLKQADVRGIVVQRMREEVDALRSSKAAVDGERGAIDANTASWQENIRARERAAQLAKAAKGEFAYDEQGFRINADGSRAEYTTGDNSFVPDGLPNGQFNTQRLTQGQIMANVARNGGKFNPQDTTVDPNGSLRPGYTGGSAFGSRGPVPGAGRNAMAETPRAASVGSGYTVVVNLNGARTSVGVASQQDADALAGVLRQLETAADRGG